MIAILAILALSRKQVEPAANRLRFEAKKKEGENA